MVERGSVKISTNNEQKERGESGDNNEEVGKQELNGESQRNLAEKVGELSQHLEKFNLAEYMNLLNNPRRFMMVNFLGGIFRGLGFAVGMTILAALVLYILQWLVLLNLPIIGDFIAELVRIVIQHL